MERISSGAAKVSELQPGDVMDLSDRRARIQFWTSMAPWFAEHGYTLYQVKFWDSAYPKLEAGNLSSDDTSFPYSYFGDWRGNVPFAASLQIPSGSVFYAQDAQLHHVAIKLVPDDSEEYRIIRRLEGEQDLCSEHNFPSIVPILDVLSFKDYHFVIMPRWGPHCHLPPYLQTYEVYTYIHSLLKAVEFLHTRKIVHGDIAARNVLMNHFGSAMPKNSTMRAQLRSQSRIRYGLFDFDMSVMFPADATPSQCRLPYWRSWSGNVEEGTYDTSQGEYDYDPFALDMGTLGAVLCHFFQFHVSRAPMLAPFLDRLITRDISKRFTATEARLFFEEKVIPQTTRDQLLSSVINRELSIARHFDRYDRWKDLPADFVRKWGDFRESLTPPWNVRVLRWLCRRPWMHFLVIVIRRFFTPITRMLAFRSY